MSITVEQITKPVQLGKAPHWDGFQQCLYYVSILDNTIHKYNPSTNTETKTKLSGNTSFIIPITGMSNEFVVGVERKVLKIEWDGENDSDIQIIAEITEVDTDEDLIANKLNAGKADPSGRLFAGTIGKEESPGEFATNQSSLYLIDTDGAHYCDEVGKVSITGGMCWDREKNIMYFIDSFEKSVRAYDYDSSNGTMTNQRVVLDFVTYNLEGMPSGMTIDTDGNIWVACFDGTKIIKVNPENGKILQKIPIPAMQVTSVAFGGVDLDELYVTTAKLHITSEQKAPCGAVFKITGLGVKGYAGDGCVLCAQN